MGFRSLVCCKWSESLSWHKILSFPLGPVLIDVHLSSIAHQFLQWLYICIPTGNEIFFEDVAYQYISIYWLQILETSTAICITDRSRYISYLTNRSQSVCVNGIVSEPQKIDFGVPQGSASGPLLFTMCINEISHVVRYSNVEQYADDTLLYFASDDVNIIESNLSSDLDSVFVSGLVLIT